MYVLHIVFMFILDSKFIPECFTNHAQVNNFLFKHNSLAFKVQASGDIHRERWCFRLCHFFLDFGFQMIDIDSTTEWWTWMAILKLNKECFVGTVHVSMIKVRFLKFKTYWTFMDSKESINTIRYLSHEYTAFCFIWNFNRNLLFEHVVHTWETGTCTHCQTSWANWGEFLIVLRFILLTNTLFITTVFHMLANYGKYLGRWRVLHTFI